MRSVIAGAWAGAMAVALAGCATLGVGQSGEQAAERVLAAYRIGDMLAQAAPILNEALDANIPAEVGEAERTRLRRAVSKAYDGDVLTAAVADRLAQRAREAERVPDLRHAAEQLESDLAQAMIAREDSAGDEEFNTGFREFLQQPVTEESDRAVARVRQLAADLQLVELQTVFNLGLLQGMVTARNTVAPPGRTTSKENLARMMRETSEGLDQRLSRRIPLMLLYVYRDASEEQRAAYIQLQRDEALRWINGALAGAVEDALDAAAETLPGHYRDLTTEEN